jgi:hypothetical protein
MRRCSCSVGPERPAGRRVPVQSVFPRGEPPNPCLSQRLTTLRPAARPNRPHGVRRPLGLATLDVLPT